MPSTLMGLTRGLTSFRKSQSSSQNESTTETEPDNGNCPNDTKNEKSGKSTTSSVSRKRSPNTRTLSTVNTENIKTKRHLGSTSTSSDNKVGDDGKSCETDESKTDGDNKMETDACATTENGGQVSISSASSSNSSSGYSSSRSNKQAQAAPHPHNLSRGGSKSAENGKENRVPSTSLIAPSGRGDASPVPVIKNRPQRSYVGYMSPYEQFLRFTETDPKYRSEKSQGKILGLYKFCGEIGSGNFSKVKLGIHQLTKERVAIKIIEKSRVQEKMERMLSREVRSMEVLNHQNLIRLYEVMETGTKIYLISEWAPAGDLYSKVTLRGKLPEYDAKPIFRQILAALIYMHGNGIIHRDLKAENVFFSTGTICKVGDFGFSTTGYKGQLLSTFCGSPPYAAPELYKDEAYEGGPVDAWALGVLLYFMTEGRLPFIGTSIPNLKRNILNGEYMMSGSLSTELMDLIQKILQQRPSRRLTVPEMIVHPWLLPDSCIGSQVFSKSIDSSASKTSDYCEDECGDSCSSTVNSRQTHCSIIRRDTNGKLFPATKNRAICRSLPTKEQIMYKLVSPNEIQSYEVLLDMGIPDQMIEAHRSRGVRSYVVGIYRMLLHKLEKGDEIDFARFSMNNWNGSLTNFNNMGYNEPSQPNPQYNSSTPSAGSGGGNNVAPKSSAVSKGPVKMNSNHSPIRIKDPSAEYKTVEESDENETVATSMEEDKTETEESNTGDNDNKGENKNEADCAAPDLKDMELNDIPKSQFLSTKLSKNPSQPEDLEGAVANCQAVPSTTCTIL